MARISLTKLLLVLLNLGLIISGYLLWSRGQHLVQEPSRLPPPNLQSLDLAELNSTPVPSVDVTNIREHAVLYTSRSFFKPAPPAVVATPPDYEITGILKLFDGKRIAFVRSKADHSTRTLHVGDDLDGWRINVIDQDHIGLNQAEQSTELRVTTAAPASPGLIRGQSVPQVASSGLHILGSAGMIPSQSAGRSRNYRPPPVVGK
jgi:hypothetical protein